MVESIYFLKPAWCGNHFAGLWPEQGLQPVTRATAFRRWFVTFKSCERPTAAAAFRPQRVMKKHSAPGIGMLVTDRAIFKAINCLHLQIELCEGMAVRPVPDFKTGEFWSGG
jgi:hypothetical protein